MPAADTTTTAYLTKALVAGAAVGTAVAATIIGLDLGFVASMIDGSRGGAVLTALFVGGSALKGAVFSVAVADFDRRSRSASADAVSPVAARA